MFIVAQIHVHIRGRVYRHSALPPASLEYRWQNDHIEGRIAQMVVATSKGAQRSPRIYLCCSTLLCACPKAINVMVFPGRLSLTEIQCLQRSHTRQQYAVKHRGRGANPDIVSQINWGLFPGFSASRYTWLACNASAVGQVIAASAHREGEIVGWMMQTLRRVSTRQRWTNRQANGPRS
jgi:hypothetical protein